MVIRYKFWGGFSLVLHIILIEGKLRTKFAKHGNFRVYIISYPSGTKWLVFATSIEQSQPTHPFFILLADQHPSSYLDKPINDNGQFQKWNVDYSIWEI